MVRVCISFRALWLESVPTITQHLAQPIGMLARARTPITRIPLAKLQHSHCGSRMFCQLFSKKFRVPHFCCSVAVLQFSQTISHTQKILLYLYINIEFIFDFYIIYFWTATLQHCNRVVCNWLLLSALIFVLNFKYSNRITKKWVNASKIEWFLLFFMWKRDFFSIKKFGKKAEKYVKNGCYA